jgi:hypothetical protein
MIAIGFVCKGNRRQFRARLSARLEIPHL